MALEEQVQAPILYAELLSKPATERLDSVRKNRQFSSYLLAEMLLEKSREARFDDLTAAQEAAALAWEVVDQLDEEAYGSVVIRALKARALCFLANTERIKADFRKAEEYFVQMEALLEGDLLEPLEWAELMAYRASLYSEMREIDKANEVLDRMMEIYREAEDTHQTGRALLQRGHFLFWNDDVDGALEAVQAAMPLIDGRRDPRMVALAWLNLAVLLNAAGRSEEAFQAALQARPISEMQGDRLQLIKVRWVEGRIYASLGRMQEAEQAYLEVRRQYKERGIDYDHGLVCLDLALLYAEEGRNEKIRALAVEMVPLFQSHNLGRETTAALILFQHAAQREIATIGLIREIVDYLKRAQKVVWMSDDT